MYYASKEAKVEQKRREFERQRSLELEAMKERAAWKAESMERIFQEGLLIQERKKQTYLDHLAAAEARQRQL